MKHWFDLLRNAYHYHLHQHQYQHQLLVPTTEQKNGDHKQAVYDKKKMLKATCFHPSLTQLCSLVSDPATTSILTAQILFVRKSNAD